MPSNHETQGVLSPLLRNWRLSRVARRIARGSVVLDLACGTGALRHLLPEGCRYFGVDRIPLSSPPWKTHRGVTAKFLHLDLEHDDSPRVIADWIRVRPTIITMIALLEHLGDSAAFVTRYMPLLDSGGRVVGTTPHPRGRLVHDSLASIGICSKDGADEHETFLGRSELVTISEACGAVLSHYQVFLLGLNQAFEFTFPDKSADLLA